jgi:hypothetical protein
MRIVFNGKEVTNPFARATIGAVAIAVFVLFLLLVLPLIGIVFAISLGIFLWVFAVILLVLFIGISFYQPRKSNHVPLEKPKDK